jgi:hypothetical protein
MNTQNEQIPTGQQPTKDERTWAMLCHLSVFLGFLFPFGNLLAPLVIWLIKKDEYSFVDDQGKEVVNFQISLTIYFIISILLVFIVVGIPLLIGLVAFAVIITIVAAIKSNEGEKYRYPANIRFLN